MRTVVRALATLSSAVATYFFVFWAGGVLLLRVNRSHWIPSLVALVAACFVGWLVWSQTAPLRLGLLQAIAVGAFVTGSIAFSLGFFGPILFTPGANQGPLLGLLITGPIGFLLGAVGGAVVWIVRRNRQAEVAGGGTA
jgi:hypothetical protein